MNDAFNAGVGMERLAMEMLSGLESQHAALTKSGGPPIVGTPMTERCAHVAETRCGACLEVNCAFCQVAADIRQAADRLMQERDEEIAKTFVGDVVGNIVSGLCAKHSEFGRELLAEHYKRQAWSPGPAGSVHIERHG